MQKYKICIYIVLYFLIGSSSSFLSYSTTAYIIVHGTFAAGSSWYQPGGDFYDAILQSIANESDSYVVPFTWSGKYSDTAREQAAFELAHVLSLYDKVILIGHSHGANVGLLACHLLPQLFPDQDWQSHILEFYALGVPVVAEVVPNMFVIKSLYNLFSFQDPIQSVFGMCERTFYEHERIYNLSVLVEGVGVSHERLHCSEIAQMLLHTPDSLLQQSRKDVLFGGSKPGILNFIAGRSAPLYREQHDQKDLLEQDKFWTRLIMFELLKTLD